MKKYGGAILGVVEKSVLIKAKPENVWEMLAFDKIQEWEEGWGEDLGKIEYTSEILAPEDKHKFGSKAPQ